MGIFSSLFSRKPKVTIPHVLYADFVVDLTEFRCGKTKLGDELQPNELYTEFIHENKFSDEEHGVEIGLKSNRLDYIQLTLDKYPGKFRYNGVEEQLGPTTTMSDILSLCGEPYWHDDDKDESILFYEDGTVELQLEFPDKKKLGVIIMLLDPLMAKKDQRDAYGVTKEWPPNK